MNSLTAEFVATALHASPQAPIRAGGDRQAAEVGTPLDSALEVRVTDRHGNPVAGVAVAWKTDGDGFVVDPDTITGADGHARTYWTLPTAAGGHEARARVGTDTVIFRATAVAAEVATMERAAGDGQDVPAGEVVVEAPSVRLFDRFGNPVIGVPVRWDVTAGGGQVVPYGDATGADGIARAAWTLGTEGEQTLRARTDAGLSVSFTASLNPCSRSFPDTDGDGLPDCAETGTAAFLAWYDAGTDAGNPDTDGDGLPDGDEVFGTADGLDLPAFGVSPLRRDLLLEHDWFEDDGGDDCAPHSHRPPAEALEQVRLMFRDAPVANPDGSTGVNLIHDYGQGGVFTGGTLVADDDGLLDGTVLGPQYSAIKGAEMAQERQGIFHYVLHAHRYGTAGSGSAGQATLSSDRMVITLQCWPDQVDLVAHVVAHELGHNLSLRHGGDEQVNHKPNYNSVMNYRFQWPGADTDCDGEGDGVLDFSRGLRPDLNENALDERAGVCGRSPGMDWDLDGLTTGTGVVADINRSSDSNPSSGDGAYGILRDHDDWSRLSFYGPARFMNGAMLVSLERIEPELPVCQGPPDRVTGMSGAAR